MRSNVARVLIAVACAAWLAGCETARLSSFGGSPENEQAAANANAADDPVFPSVDQASAPDPATTGSVPEAEAVAVASTTSPGLLGSSPYDDLGLAKRHFRETNYGLAEKHYRKAVEQHPRDAEAWLGLAASYDRLKRFDLADRAYAQTLAIAGPRVEVLNNQGYSFMLRGDYRRAREKLLQARMKEPKNAHVLANLQLLEESTRKGKGLQ